MDRFRARTEQSDYLYFTEKKLIVDELNRIEILIGHYAAVPTDAPVRTSSYLDTVRYFASLPYDHHEHSYHIEPIYYPANHILFIPYGFLSLSNASLEYSIVKLLLKVLRQTIRSNPFNIECLIKSSNDIDSPTADADDEHIVYLLFRSKFLSEEHIVLDEYLWPFMSANTLMKRFLIAYTANYFCPSDDGRRLFRNHTYLLDDIHLVFHCPQASSIRQSKCSVT